MSVENTEGVTFVDGHAVEQDGGSDGPEEGSQHADELEAARAAVRKAIAKEAGEDGAKKAKESEEKRLRTLKAKSDREEAEDEVKAKASGKTQDEAEAEPEKPKARAKEEEDDGEIDPEKSSIKQILKNREKLAKVKQQQASELQQHQQYLQQMQQQVQAERAAIERERQRLALLKKDPVRAVTEAGWDPDEFILSLAQEGTPEGKMARMLREQQEKLAAFDQWKADQAQALQRQQEEFQYRQAVQARQNVEKSFTSGALNPEKYPHLADFYVGREGALIAEGDLVAGMYRDATGQEATLEKIAQYIEDELAERANNWYMKKQGTGKVPNGSQQVATPKDTGKPARGGSKGKTLTGSATSERRALSKDLTDLDGDERLLAAREAVKVAMATSRSE